MNYDQLMAEIRHLSIKDRLALLEDITHSLQVELGQLGLTGSERQGFQGEPAPDENILEDDFTDYLLEKYP